MARPIDGPGPGEESAPSLFLGSSEAAQTVRRECMRAARVDAAVLITGESGVGKELVAREIHARSKRSRGPFVALNCAAIPDTLIESELFGHEAGAYTDARTPRRGAFELADHGTLFLDEVGDLSPLAQPKLLRAIETGEVMRVGGETSRHVDLRVLAATNHDLKAMSREGRFRTDLYYRLNVIELRVPPLRDRIQDVRELAAHFARQIAGANARPFTEIAPDALELLEAHNWPGNVRELRSTLERALALTSGTILDSSCFHLDPASSSGLNLKALLAADWKTAQAQFGTAYARQLLHRHGGSVAAAARAARLSPRSLYKMLRRLGLKSRSGGGGTSGSS